MIDDPPSPNWTNDSRFQIPQIASLGSAGIRFFAITAAPARHGPRTNLHPAHKLATHPYNQGKFPGEIAETGEAEKLGPANRFK